MDRPDPFRIPHMLFSVPLSQLIPPPSRTKPRCHGISAVFEFRVADAELLGIGLASTRESNEERWREGRYCWNAKGFLSLPSREEESDCERLHMIRRFDLEIRKGS